MLRITGVAHFTLGVRDIGRSLDFYCGILGLELLARVGDDMAFLRAGKDQLVLSRGNAPVAQAPVPLHQAFIVESRDFDDAVTFLTERRIEIVQQDERDGPFAVFAGRSAYFPDPDGNMLEIIDLRATAHRPLQSPRSAPPDE